MASKSLTCILALAVVALSATAEDSASRQLLDTTNVNSNSQTFGVRNVDDSTIILTIAANNAQANYGDATAKGDATTVIDRSRLSGRKLMGDNINSIVQGLKFKYIGNGQVAISLANAQSNYGDATAVATSNAVDYGRKLLDVTNVNSNNQAFGARKVDDSTIILTIAANSAQANYGKAKAKGDAATVVDRSNLSG